jgi:hypothetical protein
VWADSSSQRDLGQTQYQVYSRWQTFKIASTDSNDGHKVCPNLLAGLQVNGINHAWVADITYVQILVGFVDFGRAVGPLLAQRD